MTELDPRIQASIGRSLGPGSHSPPAGAEERMLAQFHAALGGPPDGGSGGVDAGAGPSLAGGGQVLHAIKIVAAVVGLTAAGLGGVALLGKAVRGARVERPPIIDASAQPDTAGDVGGEGSDRVAGAPVDANPDPPDDAEPAAHAELAAHAEHAEHAEASGSNSRPPGTRTAATSTGPTSMNTSATLAAELQLIRAARSAPATEALELLDQHNQRFPNGELSREREGLRVIALCQLERFDEAQRASERFVAGAPGELLIQRVETACRNKISLPTTEPKPAGHR